MYDLPSEDPESPGLPDEFHDLQTAMIEPHFPSLHTILLHEYSVPVT